MPVSTTARATGILNTESRRVRDVSEGIFKLEPDSAPLTVLMARLRKKQVDDPKIEWFEDELIPRFDTLGNALAAGDATMTVSNFAYFRSGDLWQVADKEIVLVTATPTGTSVTITRGVGVTYTTGQAAANGGKLRLIASSAAENALGRDLLSTQKVPKFNYTEIFKHPFAVSRTAKYTKTFAGKDMVEEQANQLIEHRKDIEMAFLIGEKFEGSASTLPQRSTGGILPYLVTNISTIASLTEAAFEGFLRRAFRYGKKQKVFLGASNVMTIINGFARGKLQIVPKDQSYGVTLNEYMNSGRRLMLAEHPLLENELQTDISGLAGYGIVLDIEDLVLRYIGPNLAELQTNIQANDRDGRQDQYLSEVGLESHLEKKHGWLKGVTS